MFHIPFFFRPAKGSSYDHIPSDNFPRIDHKAEAIGLLGLIAFNGILVFAWNFTFPTATERTLWRVASASTLAAAACDGGYFLYCHLVFPRKRKNQEPPIVPQRTPYVGGSKHLKNQFQALMQKARKCLPNRDSDSQVPLRMLIPISIITTIYTVFRLYILIQDIIGLRRLPTSAFQNVKWSKYIPHL
jgi:hypothetical protein